MINYNKVLCEAQSKRNCVWEKGKEKLRCWNKEGSEFKSWTAVGTNVTLLLCVLHTGQPSPDGSHSNTGCKMCEGSWRVLWAALTVHCSKRTDNTLTRCPIILDQVLIMVFKRVGSCRVMELNQQVNEKAHPQWRCGRKCLMTEYSFLITEVLKEKESKQPWWTSQVNFSHFSSADYFFFQY